MRRPYSAQKHFAKAQPSAASNRAAALNMIYARIGNGLDIEPSMLAKFGIKPAEAERMIAKARSGNLL